MKKLITYFCCYVATILSCVAGVTNYVTIQNIGNCDRTYNIARYVNGSYSSQIYAPATVAAGATRVWAYLDDIDDGHPTWSYVLRASSTAIINPLRRDSPFYTVSTPNACDHTVGESDSSTNMCNITICIRNNDATFHTYTFWKNNVQYLSAGGSVALALAPGERGCATYEIACTNASGWSLGLSQAERDYGYTGDNATDTSIVTNTTVLTYPGTTNNVTPVDPSVYTPAQTNILWTAQSTTNSIISQQVGDSAIKDAIDRASLATVKGLSELQGAVEGMGTNGGGMDQTTLTNMLNRFRLDNTNLLTGILQTMTNGATNGIYTAADYQTNWTAAGSQGGAVAADAITSGQDLIDGLGTRSGVFEGAGSAADLSIAFVGGTTLNLDPENVAPGAMGMVKTLITLVVSLLFIATMAKLFYDAAKTFSAAQTGGVANMQMTFAGFGGNVAGVATAPLVAVAFILLWTAVLVLVANTIVGGCWDMASAMGAASSLSLPPVTQYLMNATIPVNLILCLTFTTCLVYLTAGKAVIFAAAASRFLIGK